MRYEVCTADPSGHWLMPKGSRDPNEWVWIEQDSPVAEIGRLCTRVADLEAAMERHLCGNDIADWIACAGGHNHCVVCGEAPAAKEG